MAQAITKEDLHDALKELRQDIHAEFIEFKEEVRVDFQDLRKSMNEEFTAIGERFDTVESANLELLRNVKNLVTELKTHHIPSLNEDRIFG